MIGVSVSTRPAHHRRRRTHSSLPHCGHCRAMSRLKGSGREGRNIGNIGVRLYASAFSCRQSLDGRSSACCAGCTGADAQGGKSYARGPIDTYRKKLGEREKNSVTVRRNNEARHEGEAEQLDSRSDAGSLSRLSPRSQSSQNDQADFQVLCAAVSR